MVVSTGVRRFLAWVAFSLLLCPVSVFTAEAEEAAGEAKAPNPFFALDRPDLDGERRPIPSIFGDALGPQGAALRTPKTALSRFPFAEERALSPNRSDTSRQIQVPPGFCSTRRCKTLVVIGAAVAGGGVTLIATGGDRKLGTALALGGCGLIIVALLID